MSFAGIMDGARRYALLHILAAAPEYRAGASVLYEILKLRGPSCGFDRVLSTLRWLEASELVTLDEMDAGPGHMLVVATLTPRGLDVAAGREAARGVRRPLPGEEWRG